MNGIFDLFKKIENESPAPQTVVTHILCGLGNPGDKYRYTRHNIGFMCMDYISEKLGVKLTRLKFNALCGEASLGGRRTLLMKPQTFMNNSGEAVRDAAIFYKIPPENVIVISDDVSLPAGKMRVRRKGSDGGHNGLKSIIYQLSSDAFPRIRLGVGSPPPDFELVNWVLGEIPKAEREDVFRCIENSLPAAELVAGGDAERAMSLYN